MTLVIRMCGRTVRGHTVALPAVGETAMIQIGYRPALTIMTTLAAHRVMRRLGGNARHQRHISHVARFTGRGAFMIVVAGFAICDAGVVK